MRRVGLLLGLVLMWGGAGFASGEARFYTTRRDESGRWWMRAPDGRDTFLFGIDHVRRGGWWCEATNRKAYEENCIRKYASRAAWETNALGRLKAWGFNALAVGCDETLRHRGLGHYEILHLGDRFTRSGDATRAICPNPNGIPSTAFPNVFHPAFAAWCRAEAARLCAPVARDRDLIGYFIDNELCWWGRSGEPSEGLFETVAALPPTHAARQALDCFVARSGGRRDSAVRVAFLRECARVYFETTAAAIRAADANHLVLGCRFANLDGAAADCVWEEAGRACDVVSFNCYPWVDLDRKVALFNGRHGAPTIRAEFARVAALAKKPLLVTEWSFPALDAGLPCVNGAGQRFATQRERAEASELFAREMLATPAVVGYNSFMWLDQPKEGITRAFPENSNYGLVNERDEPYPLLTEALARVQANPAKGHCGLATYALDDGAGLRLEGALGGELFPRVSVNGRLVGRLTTMLKVADGGLKWIDATRVTRATEGGAFEIEGAQGDVRFAMRVRVAMRKGEGKFFAEVESVTNLGEKPLKVESVFFREYPAFAPGPADEPRADWVWKRAPGAKWRDATGSLEYGAETRSKAVRRFWYFTVDGHPLPDAEFAAGDAAPLAPGAERNLNGTVWIEGYARAPKMTLGVGAHLVGYDHDLLDPEVPLIRAAGFASARLTFNPRDFKRFGGWDRYDRVVNALVAAGVEPLPVLCGWPCDRADAAFLGFVREAVTRYRGKVRHWEIWNEENIEMFWQGVSAADYLALLKAVRRTILAADPTARIVLGGLAGVPVDYVKDLYRLGAKDAFDIMNVHPYCFPFPPEQTLARELKSLRQVMDAAGDGAKPVWITEMGWPTHALRVPERAVWTNGLAVARPDLTRWCAVYASHAADGTPPDETFRRQLLQRLPAGSTVETCTHTPLKARLAKGDVDLVILPFTGGYAEDSLETLLAFVKDGGTLAFAGGVPFCSKFRRLPSGDWGRLREEGESWTEAFKKFHLGFTACWRDKTLPEDARFITAERLQGGDRLIPLETVAATDGRKVPRAVVVNYASDLKGSFIIDGFWGIGYDSVEPVSERQQGEYFVRAAQIAAREGVTRFYPYVMRTPEKKAGWSEDFFGLVHADLNPKPAYERLKAMAGGDDGGEAVVVFRERGEPLRFSVKDGVWRAKGAWLKTGSPCTQPVAAAVAGDEVIVADIVRPQADANLLRFGFDGASRGVFATGLGFTPSCLAVSPDGRWLYAACAFGTRANSLWRWNLKTRAGERLAVEEFSVVRAMAFGGDGLLYASCRDPGALRVYDVSGATPLARGQRFSRGASTGGLALDAARGVLVLPGAGCEIVNLTTGAATSVPNAGAVNAIGGAVVGGRLVVADRGRNAILAVSEKGAFARVAEAGEPLAVVPLRPAPAPRAAPKPYADAKIFRSPHGDFAPLAYNNPNARPPVQAGLCAVAMPIDLNGDGLTDLVTTDVAATPVGGRFAWLNVGGKGAKALFDAPRKYPFPGSGDALASVTVGDKTLVVSASGLYEDFPKNGFNAFRPWKNVPWNIHWDKVPFQLRTLADLDGDGRLDLVAGVNDIREYGWDDFYDRHGNWKNARPHGYVWWLRNAGTGAGLPGDGEERWETPQMLRLENCFPVEAVGRVAPLPYDWDGDGDVDLLCTDASGTVSYFENVGTPREPVFNGETFPRDTRGNRLESYLNQTIGARVDFDSDGIMDVILAEEDGRVSFARGTGRLDARRAPLFEPPVALRMIARDVAFGSLATPAAVDWDGDGDIDLIVGEAGGSLAFIENLSGPGVDNPAWAEPKLLSCEPAKEPVFAATRLTPTSFREFENSPIRIRAGTGGSHLGPVEAKYGYTVVSAADWDGDGLPDLMVGSIWGKPLFFRNVGSRKSPRLAAPTGVVVEWTGEQPARKWHWFTPACERNPKEIISQWRTTPAMVDLDADGLMDLVMLDTEGCFAFFRRAKRDGRLVLLPPERLLRDEAGRPINITYGAKHASGRRKFCLVDWDGDGITDLIVNGYNAEFWKGLGRGTDGAWRFRNDGPMGSVRLAGHTTCPTAADFDGDGVPDLIVGAEDGYLYRLNNRKPQRP